MSLAGRSGHSVHLGVQPARSGRRQSTELAFFNRAQLGLTGVHEVESVTHVKNSSAPADEVPIFFVGVTPDQPGTSVAKETDVEPPSQVAQNRLDAVSRKQRQLPTLAQQLNFYDVVEADAEEVLESDVSDRLVRRLVESPTFGNFILASILVNAMCIGLYTNRRIEEDYGQVIDVMDSVFLTVFVIEILLKWKVSFRRFWRDGWNVLDFMLVFISVLGAVIRDSGTKKTVGARMLRMLRVMRAFRTLRVLGSVRKLQIVVSTFLQSLVDLANIVLLTLIVMFIFAVVGVQLFGENVHHFDDLPTAMYTLWILCTQDGWVDVWQDVDATFPASPDADFAAKASVVGCCLYFVAFIVVGAWIFMNVISGITVTNWQLFVQQTQREEKQRYHNIRRRVQRVGALEPVRGVDDVPADVWRGQAPLSIVNVDKVPLRKLENYFLVLSAIERNLSEYRALKRALNDHFRVVDRTNVLLERGGGGGGGASGSDSEGEDYPDLLAEAVTTLPPAQTGDVMSTILRLDPHAHKRDAAAQHMRHLAGQHQRYTAAYGRRRRASASDRTDGGRLLNQLISEVVEDSSAGGERRRRQSVEKSKGAGSPGLRRRRRHSSVVAPKW